MLSHLHVDERIRTGTIRIWYSFLPTLAGDERPQYHSTACLVDLSDATDPATTFFLRNRYSTHVHLTTGPIAQTHSGRRIGGRKPYPNFADTFDVRDQGEIVFEPYETLTILTNEQIALGGNVAAIVTPRVTNSDAGLVTTTAYIDPYYNGIMRVVVHNVTPKRQTLRVLEPVAQCFFFDLSSDAADEFKQQFPQKTRYFGHTWGQLLTSDREPFPRQKRAAPDRSWMDSVKRNIVPYLTFDRLVRIVALFGGGGAILASVMFVVMNVQAAVAGNIGLRTDIASLKNRVTALDASVPRSGSNEIVIRAGSNEGRVQIGKLDVPQAAHVWLTVDRGSSTNAGDFDVRYEVLPATSGSAANVELIAVRRAGSAHSDARVPVLWMIPK